MTTNRRRLPYRAIAAIGVAALASSACGTGGAGQNDDDVLAAVASTSAWGSVISAVGGEFVSVQALVEDASADPHSYESTAADVLAVSEADLFVYNGGGYDEFAVALAKRESDVASIDAFELSGHGDDDHGDDDHADEGRHDDDDHDDDDHGDDDHADEGRHDDDDHDDDDHGDDDHGHAHDHGENEHVWYDLDTVAVVADAIAERLGELSPENADAFADNATEFKEALEELEAKLEQIGADNPGTQVVSMEPVGHYLFDHAGIEDVTPEVFSNAIEAETDVPVAAQEKVLRLIENKEVAVLINNPQTETPVTTRMVAAAQDAGIPVVDISETLPEGETDYLTWVGDQIDALAAAVGG